MKEKTPSFILELEIKTDPHIEKRLETKCVCANVVYNAALSEALKRLHSLVRDPEYQAVLMRLKNADTAGRKSIYEAIKELCFEHGYTEYSLHTYIQKAQHHFKDNINSFEAQKLATRAFDAVDKIRFGEAKKVRFHKRTDYISVEGKNNAVYPLFRDGKLFLDKRTPVDVIIKRNDAYAHEALENRVKYVRLLFKIIRGKKRWYVQLIMEGVPPLKERKPGKGTVGMDPGVSTIAAVSDKKVLFKELAPNAVADAKKIRILQRAIDRSVRATNPDNYNENGTLKPRNERQAWHYSKRCIRLKAQLAEMHRKSAAKRRQAHNELANRIIAMGDTFLAEDMKMSALAHRAKKTTVNRKNGRINSRKRFGKAVAIRAPAMFMSTIERKLSYFGKTLDKVDTRAIKASQLDHSTGELIKKPLSQRYSDIDGCRVQRDLYSAFLIRHAEGGMVDTDACNKHFKPFVKANDKTVDSIRKTGSEHLKWYVRYPDK